MSENDRRGRNVLSHQCAESAKPQDPRNTISTIVGGFIVLLAPIDNVEDKTGRKRNLQNTGQKNSAQEKKTVETYNKLREHNRQIMNPQNCPAGNRSISIDRTK